MKIEFDNMKYEAWLNGLYVTQAVASVFSKNGKYPDPPSVNDQEQGHVTKEEIFKSKFEAWSKIHNKNIKKE